MKRRFRSIAALLAATFLSLPAHAETLHVFGAASLTEAFGEIGKAFESQHPGTTVEFNFAGSQVLRTQIEEGAEADVFASADRSHTDALVRQGLLGPAPTFAHNVLVVVTPAGGKRVKTLTDLARPGTKVIVAGPTVPVGRYTTQLLRRMSAAGVYGDDYSTRVQANFVSQETNVRAVLAKVTLGEADGAFVYRTDAMTADGKVRVLKIPDRVNIVAEYPIGVTTKAASKELAKQFVDYVTGVDGQATLAKYGFLH